MTRVPANFAHAICAALVLAVLAPAFGQTKPPPLIGKSRDQIVAQLGEPKSNIRAGSREMLFFAHLKVTLRNDVVIETEQLADEPPPRRITEPAAAPAAVPGANSGQTSAATPASAPAPAPATADTASAPAANPAPEAGAAPAIPPPPAEPPLEIKFVKSVSASAKSAPRPVPPDAAASPPPPPTAPPPVAAAGGTLPRPSPAAAPSEANTVAVNGPPGAMPAAGQPTVAKESSATEAAPAKPAVDERKRAALRSRWWSRRVAESDDQPVEIFSTRSYVIAAFIMIGGVAYLWWRQMQRKLELEATAVSSTPSEAAVAADTATQFTAESVGKLGQRRFERLVASYYAKTGVVAERTQASPEAPVHIKIFWKGEPKPFAGVLCLANPPALVGPQRLQELADALTAADVRRGYVVTTGKFNVEARDVAAEKHFTLLSGDLFLEKLNALPPAARADLLKDTNGEEPAPPPALA